VLGERGAAEGVVGIGGQPNIALVDDAGELEGEVGVLVDVLDARVVGVGARGVVGIDDLDEAVGGADARGRDQGAVVDILDDAAVRQGGGRQRENGLGGIRRVVGEGERPAIAVADRGQPVGGPGERAGVAVALLDEGSREL